MSREDDLFEENDQLFEEVCPNCGQYLGGESICPNCNNMIYDEDGLSEYENEDEMNREYPDTEK